MSQVELYVRIVDGISSRIYKRSPPPLEFPSNLQGALKALFKNLASGNESSSLVSNIKNMSMLRPMINFNASDLFQVQLIIR